MRKIFCLLTFIFISQVYSQGISYPEKDPDVKICLPEGWKHVYQPNFFEARSADQSEQLLMLRFGEGVPVDTAQSFLQAFLSDNTSELLFEPKETMLLNNIKYYLHTGKANIPGEEKINIKSIVFFPEENLCYGIIYFYPLQVVETYEARIMEILYSIKNIKE